MKITFHKRLFLLLTIAFAFTAVAGTLLHECGHYTIARLLGYSAKISYAYTHWDKPAYNRHMDSVFENQLLTERNKLPYIGQDAVKQVQEKAIEEDFWIIVAGPLQTLLTGCLGLLIAFTFRRQYFYASKLSFLQWLPLFMSLFWTRQTFNFFSWIGGYALRGYPSYKMDEVKIAQYLRWPIWSITAITGIIGLLVSIYINFKIVPANLRFAFIAAGFLGGLGGFLLWVNVVGPVLLPQKLTHSAPLSSLAAALSTSSGQ